MRNERTLCRNLLIILVLGARPSFGQDPPAFGFFLEGDDTVTAEPGTEVRFSLEASIATVGLAGGAAGPEAWSMALRAADCKFLELSEGTAIEEATRLLEGIDSYVQSDITEDGACAIQAVVLGIRKPVTLDPGRSPHQVLTLRVGSRVPPAGACTMATVRFADGVSSTGRPVRNVVTYQGRSFAPSVGEKCVLLGGDPCACQPPLTVAKDRPAEVQFSLSGCRRSACFRLESTPGIPLIATLIDRDGEGSGNSNSMYVRCGGQVTPSDFDQAAAEKGKSGQRLVIPAACSDLHLLVSADVIAGGQSSLTLRIEEGAVAIQGMSAPQGCSGRDFQASIRGAGFVQAMSIFSLRHASGGPTTSSFPTSRAPGRSAKRS